MAPLEIRHRSIRSISAKHAQASRFLQQSRMKKGDLSRFIEEAVKWRVLDQTIIEARAKFEDMAPEDLDAVIGEAVAAARQPAG
jgi:hypothetical protein